MEVALSIPATMCRQRWCRHGRKLLVIQSAWSHVMVHLHRTLHKAQLCHGTMRASHNHTIAISTCITQWTLHTYPHGGCTCFASAVERSRVKHIQAVCNFTTVADGEHIAYYILRIRYMYIHCILHIVNCSWRVARHPSIPTALSPNVQIVTRGVIVTFPPRANEQKCEKIHYIKWKWK